MGTPNCLMRLGLHSGLTLNSPSSDGIPINTKISLWLKGWRSFSLCFCWGGALRSMCLLIVIRRCLVHLARAETEVWACFSQLFLHFVHAYMNNHSIFFILKHCKLYFWSSGWSVCDHDCLWVVAFLHPYPLTVYRNNGEVFALSLYYRLPFNLCSLLPGVFNLSKVWYL